MLSVQKLHIACSILAPNLRVLGILLGVRVLSKCCGGEKVENHSSKGVFSEMCLLFLLAKSLWNINLFLPMKRDK